MHVNNLEQCLLHNKCKVNTTIHVLVVLIKLVIHYLPLHIHFIPFSVLFYALEGCSPSVKCLLRAPLSLASLNAANGSYCRIMRAGGESVWGIYYPHTWAASMKWLMSVISSHSSCRWLIMYGYDSEFA